MKFILIVGNPVDGFSHYGPFPNAEDASAWAEENKMGEWWIATLTLTHGQDAL